MLTRYGFIGLLTVFNIKMDVKYKTSHEVAFGIFVLNKTINLLDITKNKLLVQTLTLEQLLLS